MILTPSPKQTLLCSLLACSGSCALDDAIDDFGSPCEATHGATGQSDNAQFVLDQEFWEGCGSDFSQPLVAGTEAKIEVDMLHPRVTDPNGDLQFISGNPEVMSVDRFQSWNASDAVDDREYGVWVTAQAEGQTSLRIEQVDGTLVDSITIRVREAAFLELNFEKSLEDGALKLTVGQYIRYSTVVRDADDQVLHHDLDGSSTFESDEVAGLSLCRPSSEDSTLCEPVASKNSLHGFVVGVAPGEAVLTASIGDVETTLPVRVVRAAN